MIARLRGILDFVGTDHIVVDVGGVGYKLYGSVRLLEASGAVGSAINVYVETIVREDAILLYGFLSVQERDWFCLLLAVPGVGAKLGLAITGTLAPEDLAASILYEDSTALIRIPGVGKRLAARLIAELRDRVPAGWQSAGAAPQSSAIAGACAEGAQGEAAAKDSAQDSANAANARHARDAIDALVQLGFQRADSGRAIAKIQQGAGADAQAADLIKHALRELTS